MSAACNWRGKKNNAGNESRRDQEKNMKEAGNEVGEGCTRVAN